MAAFDSPGLLLDNATRVQAQVADLDGYIADSQVLSRQAGGRRRNRSSRRNQQRSQKLRNNRRSRQQSRNNRRNRSNRNRQRSRNQRGGMAPFGYELERPAGADMGMNVQFREEASVNPLYNEFKGPQGMLT